MNAAPDPDRAVLQARGLSKRFGSVIAADSLSLTLGSHEIVGLVGPNGAGKTTVLNLLAGELRPDQGDVVLLDRSTSGLRVDEIARRGFARTFQRPRFIGELTALENVMLGVMRQQGEGWLRALRPRTWLREEEGIAGTARRWLDRLQLAGCVDQKARYLSYGQVKLLSLAAVLAGDAPVLALDEPVAGLAPPARRQVEDVLVEATRHRAFLVIEHDLGFLRTIGSRVVLMAEGRKLLEGTPDAVLGSQLALRAYDGSTRDG